MKSSKFPFTPPNSLAPNPRNVLLGYWTCYLIDIPENSRKEEIISPNNSDETVYSCFFKTKYLAGEIAGPRICVALCILISIIGIFGVASNVVNILVLRHSTKGSSLQKLLIILAGFDMIASCFAVLTSVVLQLILDDIDRKEGTMIALKITFLLYSLGRTGSIFMTILITIERYFVVAHHFRAKAWLNSRRPLVITVIWLLLILLINLPWWLNSIVVRSPQNLSSFAQEGPLSKYPFFFVATNFGSRIYYSTWFRPIHVFIDFVLPLPLLLLFNGLLYRFIHNWNKSRQSVTGSHIREVNAAKMFSIVALALFSCHTFSIIDFIITETTNNVYRELLLFIMLAVTINAAVNSFVYYAFGQDYREYFWLLFGSEKKTRKGSRDNVQEHNIDFDEADESMLGRESQEEDVILHEKVTYKKRNDDEEAEEIRIQNERSSLLNK